MEGKMSKRGFFDIDMDIDDGTVLKSWGGRGTILSA